MKGDDIELTDGTWVPYRGILRWTPTHYPPRTTLRAVPTRPAFDPTLIACPTCRATVTQSCHTSGGNPSIQHAARLITRRCPCGDLLGVRKTYCEPCRKVARKATYTRREIRKATAQRRAA